jgi:hypothetical protein
MSTSDIDMLRLEAPATRLQITSGSTELTQSYEIAQQASWV